MTDHALIRARAFALQQDAPAATSVLPVNRPADGLCILLNERTDAKSVLMRWRDNVIDVWRVAVDDGVGRERLVLIFSQPMLVAAEDAPSALRLIRIGAGEWSSFEGADVLLGTAVRGRGRLHLWWNGRCETVALTAERSLPLETLWPKPSVTVHRPSPSMEARDLPAKAQSHRMTVLQPQRVESMRKLPDIMRQTDRDLVRRNQSSTLLGITMSVLRLFLPGVGGRSGEGEAGRAGANEPSIFSRLVGWLRWNTPLGAPLKSELARRIQVVDSLMRAGAIDDALRLALKLGSDANRDRMKRTFYPKRLPDARASLDFSIDHSRYSMPVLGDAGFHALRARYAELAKDLAARGDYRRSAYISSQLLGDHGLAVRMLEQGGLLAEAAKLAHESGQHPTLVIRLLFKLGDKEAALALAKRTGCFESLVIDSRGKDADFHAFVIKAWTDQLVETEQFSRALSVTDELVRGTSSLGGASVLASARRSWLVRALNGRPHGVFDAELIARGLLSARWSGDDFLDRALTAFPNVDKHAGQEPFIGCLIDLQDAMRRPESEARPALIAMLRAVLVHSDESAKEQATFWSGPAAIILESLARELLRKASESIRREDLDDLRSLLLKASSPVLAEDFRKIRSIYRSGPVATEARIMASRDQAVRAHPAQVCVFANGEILLSRQGGELELRGRRGEALWSGWLEDIVGLVAVGESRNALIVQRDRIDGVRLSRFSCVEQRVTPIGAVALAAWHDMTSENQWLVQIEGDVGALDLVELMSDQPRIAFLWSMRITERLLVRAFYHDPLSPAWLTVDLSPARAGVQELWTLWQGRELRTRVLTGIDVRKYASAGGPNADPLPFGCWRLHTRQGVPNLSSLNPAEVGASMQIIDWSDAAESAARRSHMRRVKKSESATDQFQSEDFGRVHVFMPVAKAATMEFRIANATGRHLVLSSDIGINLSLAARAPVRARDGALTQVAVFADAFGRLHSLDLLHGVLLTLE